MINTTDTSMMTPSPNTKRKQKQLGPAPIASIDSIDIPDEMESSSPPESSSRLPDIKEHPPSATFKRKPSPINTNVTSSLTSTSVTSNYSTSTRTTTTTTTVIAANTLHTPTTPRIDISRASSSSHHDSRESSPENVFDQVGTGTLIESGLGFKEEGAMDLRSSTEELHNVVLQ
uniref:CSON013808 protein n=1 Tax=Culicoides sonorensis TaxID=179676 RepID=A0A336MBP0_CULSO